MKLIKFHPWYNDGNSPRLTAIAFVVIAIIAILNALVVPFVGFGYLYLLPLIVAAAFMSRGQIFVLAVICTAFAEGFSKLPEGLERYPRVVFVLTTFLLTSFLVKELVVFQRAAERRLKESESEISELHTAEQELDLLLNSSAIGIMTVSPEGNIVRCNRAAHDVFSVGLGGLAGQSIAQFLPIEVMSGQNGGPIECSGRTADGQTFCARVWRSTFSRAGTDMTTIIVDASQDRLADRTV